MSGLMLTYLGQSFDKHEPMDLSEVSRSTLPMLQAIMSGDVVLEIDLPSPGPVIMANANQIMQVLTNLITNAYVMAGEHAEWPQVFLGKPYNLKGLSDAISQALRKK